MTSGCFTDRRGCHRWKHFCETKGCFVPIFETPAASSNDYSVAVYGSAARRVHSYVTGICSVCIVWLLKCSQVIENCNGVVASKCQRVFCQTNSINQLLSGARRAVKPGEWKTGSIETTKTHIWTISASSKNGLGLWWRLMELARLISISEKCQPRSRANGASEAVHLRINLPCDLCQWLSTSRTYVG